MLLVHQKVKLRILISQVLAVIPFLIFIFVLFDLWYDTRRTLILEQNLSNSRLLGNYLTNSINHSIGIAKSLSDPEIFGILDNTNPSDKSRMKSIFKTIQENQHEVDSVSLFSPGGALIESSYEYPVSKSNSNIADRDYFQKAITTKKPAVSTAIFGKLSGNYIVAVASPIVINNQIEGVILVNINLENIKRNFEAAYSSTDPRRTLIIDKDGNIVLELYHGMFSDDQKSILKDNTHITQALKGESSVIDNEKLPISGKTMLGFTVPVEVNGDYWTIMSIDSAEDIYLPIIRIQSFLWLLILISVVFVLTVVSYFLRKIKIIY